MATDGQARAHTVTALRRPPVRQSTVAEEFAKGDPFVRNGVVRHWHIREWNEALVP